MIAGDGKVAPDSSPCTSWPPTASGKRCLEADGVVETPLYFPSAGRTLFGWLSCQAAPAAPVLGVVICSPFGYESICAHRGMRVFAATAAAIGLPALRFDYVGTGDSEDSDPQADHIQPWVKDIVAAVGELQRRTHVERVCLLGFRLGALLAALAAPVCGAVTGLALIAPIVSGRRYVRELRMLQLAAPGEGAGRLGGLGLDERSKSSGDPPLEVGGFPLSAASAASLSELDLTELQPSSAQDVLIIDRNDLPSARTWASALSASGARTQYLSLPGYVEMMTRPPYYASVPEPTITATREWLLALQHSLVSRHGIPATSAPSTAHREPDRMSAPLPFADGGSATKSALIERAVFFGTEPLLFGVATEPPADRACRKAVILVNDGASHHVGSKRLYVSLARNWSRRGCVVLRMDLAGIGDSETRPGRAPDEVFPPAAIDDIRTAIEFVRGRYGVDDITLAGVCSGAYHSLRAAVAGLAVDRILLVNPRNFFWTQDTPLEALDSVEAVPVPQDYARRLFSAADWRRLVRGQISVRETLNGYLKSAINLAVTALRASARCLHIRLAHDLGRELEELGARGVQIAFVFASGEPAISVLRLQGGSSVKRLGRLCHLHIIDGADHTFSRSRVKAELEETLTAELFGNH